MKAHLNKIGALSSVGLVIGSIVGTGIFVTPKMVAEFSTNLGVTFLLWGLGGMLCWIGGEIYGQLGERFPIGGGQYIYLERSLGKPIALVYGWMSFLVISPSMIASYSMFFGEQATTYLPNLSQIQIQLLAIGFISIVTAINYFGIRATGDFEKIVVSLQILLILVLFASLSFWGQPSSPLQSSSISTPSITTAAAAIVGILWSYEGFNCLSFVAHEIQDSSKRLSSYIVTGCAVVMIVYFLLNYLTLRHLSSDELIQAPNIATPLSTLAFGDLGGKFTFAMMMIAVFMTSVPAVLIGPRVTQQMAREGWLPRRLQEIHPRYTSPHIAILAQFVVASLFVFLGNFEWLISCFITISWCFYILVAVGYWRICRKESGKLSSAQFVKLLFFILLALVVIGVQTSRDPLLSLLGGGLLAASFFTARWRLKKLGASEYAR